MSYSIDALCAAFPGGVSVLCADLRGEGFLHAREEGRKLPAGTAIALPMLVCALEQVRRERLSLNQALPGGETLEQALAAMLAGDTGALEGVTQLVTPQRADEYFQGTLGIRDTACGPHAHTSNQSLFYLLRRLDRGEMLTGELRRRAMAMLPSGPACLGPEAVGAAGRGEGLCHWAGLVPGPNGPRYLGVCSWETAGEDSRGAVEQLLRVLADGEV